MYYECNFLLVLLDSDLQGSNVRINLSPTEILKLAGKITAKSKQVHDAVASVPLEKVSNKLYDFLVI